MNRYQRAKELFQAALDHDQGERMTFLAGACAGDVELQQEVEQLLAHHDEAASFIESPAVEAVLKALQGNRSPSLAGQHIGPYQIIREICAAVQHAHQNLIVHRDLKPSNILVTSDGEPKLLDFGIAKFLNPEMSPQTIAPTMTAMRLMTRDYASPEQVRGFPITTAS